MDGKVIVVTGAGGGQGAAEAVALAGAGAVVIAVDLADDPGPDLQVAIPGLPSLSYRRVDVTDHGDWSGLARHLQDSHGRVDGLVNNAGVTARARLLDLTVEDLERVHRVNVTGPLLGMQAMAPLMSRGGSIVNVGSVAAVNGHYAIAYTTSKWALRGLSKAASLELGSLGIRVNLVNPGFIDTPMTATAPSSFRAATLADTPLGRSGTVDDVAPLLVYLMSDESSFVSGAEIPVDGGYSGHGGAKSVSDALLSR